LTSVTGLQMKSLIAYFSRKGNNYVGGSVRNLPVGNTEVAAGMIRRLVQKAESVISLWLRESGLSTAGSA
jgi:flavodoxin